MKKEDLARKLNISRKTLYNYMNNLNITELTEENILILEEYSSKKNESKNTSKEFLLSELERLKKENYELSKNNEFLLQGQTALLEQVDYYKNSIDSEISIIKNQIKLLLPPPEEEKNNKKSFFNKLFKK